MRRTSITAAVRWTAPIWRILYSKWFGGAAFMCLLVAGIVWWFVIQDTLPGEISIATGAKDGQYYLYGEVLKESIETIGRNSNVTVTLLDTEGSGENRELLLAEKAHLAIIQHGAVKMDRLAVIAPLYEEVVHVVVRKGRGIQSIRDLSGRNVVLGKQGSGMQKSAIEILKHYGAKKEELGDKTDSYFTDLIKDENLDAAIVTTGYVNDDLRGLLADGRFELIAVDDAEAISTRHAHFMPAEIPQSLYGEGPAVPDQRIETVATTAILVAPSEVIKPSLVEVAVTAVYEGCPQWEGEDSRRQIAQLMTVTDARKWAQLPLHPVTQTYFEPYKALVQLKDYMESIVATKELLFTLGAGIYILWLWRRTVVRRRNEADLAVHMQRLNALLDETIRIESQQMKTDDPKELRRYLEEVTQIKLRALDRLTDEDLRGDQMFAIFLTQCSNLSRKIQLKIRLPVDPQT